MGQVVVDGCDQFLHTAKDAPAKASLRQLAEPALDEVEPRGTRGREVQREARVGVQPPADGWMFVGPVVVQKESRAVGWSNSCDSRATVLAGATATWSTHDGLTPKAVVQNEPRRDVSTR